MEIVIKTAARPLETRVSHINLSYVEEKPSYPRMVDGAIAAFRAGPGGRFAAPQNSTWILDTETGNKASA